MMIGKVLRYVVMPGVVLVMTACGTGEQARRSFVPNSAEAIASAKVAVLSVSSWVDVQSELQPNFEITEKIALSSAVPTTQQMDERLSQAFGAFLRADAPSLTGNSTVTRESATGVPSTESAKTTETRATGDVSSLAAPKPPSAGASGLPGAPGATPDAIDPMLRYLAAASLYQEVKMLNRYVADAAVTRDSDAYVLRLQVSLMPKRRQLPYDAYTTIAVIPDDIEQTWYDPKTKSSVRPSGQACPGAAIEVIPLLVTDDLEAMMSSRSAESVQQLGLALLATIQGFGLGGEFNKTRDLLQHAVGREVNSLFSLQHLGGNRVLARFGAAQNPASSYAMEARTHNVTLLVNFHCPNGLPKEPTHQKIAVMAHTEFVSALDGGLIKEDDAFLQTQRNIDDIKRKYRISDPNDKSKKDKLNAHMAKMVLAEARNQWDEFVGLVPDLLTLSNSDPELSPLSATEVVAGLWADFSAMSRLSLYSYTTFDADVGKKTGRLPPKQDAVLEDGKDWATVTVYGGKQLTASNLAVTLRTTDPALTLVASSVTVGNNGSSVNAGFHALAPLGVTRKTAATLIVDLLEPNRNTASPTNSPSANTGSSFTYHVHTVTASNSDTKKNQFTIKAASAGVVMGSGGTGTVHVIVVKDPAGDKAPVYLAVQGADVARWTKVGGGNTSRSVAGMEVTAGGEYEGSLINLQASRELSVYLQDKDLRIVGSTLKASVLGTAGSSQSVASK